MLDGLRVASMVDAKLTYQGATFDSRWVVPSWRIKLFCFGLSDWIRPPEKQKRFFFFCEGVKITETMPELVDVAPAMFL